VNSSAPEHIPVLTEKLAEQINLPPDGVMVDATIGHGGHSFLFGKKMGPEGLIIGLDLDKNSIKRAHLKLKSLHCRLILINENFANIKDHLHKHRIDKLDFILADLGICSAQLTDAKIGLSFNHDMPLDMRFDKRLKTSAADIVNSADEKNLADIIYKFGQDRASRRIARFIVRHRRQQSIKTTGQLAAIICRALAQPAKKRKSRIHPATRTFQALRIAVNSELENLEKLLEQAPTLLKENGKIAVISYHSLEDRLVKNSFRKNLKEGVYSEITKKPIAPAKTEIAENPRARSAKLRIAKKKLNKIKKTEFRL